MKLRDLLPPDGILTDVDANDLGEVLLELLDTLPVGDDPAPELRRKFARDLSFGSVGEVVRASSDLVAVIASRESPEGTAARLAIARGPFRVTGEGLDKPAAARAALLVLTNRRPAAVRDELATALGRWSRAPGHEGALAAARTADDVRGLDGFLELELQGAPQVGAAMSPVTYRVYPSTPLAEVVDLMVRRELHAVPVVGEDYEVLGIITSGDALRDLLPRRRSAGAAAAGRETEGLTARDVMTRTVMCVSEEQPLVDAASLMVNRDVEQLPVVREGELIGLLTRDAVLRALFNR